MAYTTIDDPTIHFNTKLYTGTGSGNNAVTGLGFAPDWVWTKNRASNYSHNLYDSVRGTGKYLVSDGTAAESSSATSIVSFDSDGFTVGTGDNVQYESANGVSWNWAAGGSASSNTDGDETTSVSVNQTAGFSIVSYTGTGSVDTFGHGLGVKPNVMIQKKRSGSAAWTVYHDKVDANPSHKYLYLNSTAALADYADHFNDTEPTSSVFTLGTDTSVNGSSATNIMYCFAEKQGYSKFGSYVASGNDSDANFIYTGFKPAWILFRRTDPGDNWLILDNKRSSSSGGNLIDFHLRANLTNAEEDLSGAANGIDFLSNGFKLRKNNGEFNSTDRSFIYMAFAESPFVNSSGVPCNAK